MQVAVIGATGRLGRALVERLHTQPIEVLAVGRSTERLAGLGVPSRVAPVEDAPALRAALAGATHVASCVHARFAAEILAALPERLERVVLTGSTRRFTRFPDVAASQVAAAEAAFFASGRRGVMLHPTMIYGAEGENNLRRVAAYIRRFGVIPLPCGGRALIQPVHMHDVVSSLVNALFGGAAPGPPVVVAGPEPVSYRALVEAVAHAIGRRVRIVSVPAAPLIAAAKLTCWLPGVPGIASAEVRRLLEDKAFDIGPMRERLGVEPMSLETGLRLTFGTT